MEVVAFIFILCLLAGAVLILWVIIAFVRAVLAPNSTGQQRLITRDQGDNIDGMNEGDIHSGPYGYSPGTAYPETQYGSGFDPDAEWNRDDR
jgi:hypothetical protein